MTKPTKRYSKRAKKRLVWVGDSKRVLDEFPPEVRQDMGFQLHKVQAGEEPSNWKPMNDVGPGTKEIRIQDEEGWYRAFYVTKFGDVVYVLHAFQKKSNASPPGEIRKGSKRYDAVKHLHEHAIEQSRDNAKRKAPK